MSVPSLSAINRLLKPRSVAIVGASDKRGALGATVLSNLESKGFSGDIFPINPGRESIGRHKCFPSVSALPGPVDLAILAIPKAAVLDTVRELAAIKAGAVIVFSAGFAEGSEQGIADQLELARIAAEAKMVVLGPNCMGALNFRDSLALTFSEMPDPKVTEGPMAAIVSQSGAMASILSVTLMSRAVPMSYTISTGNEAASGAEDYVEYLIEDAETKVIALLIEQFRSPARFLELARRASRMGKFMVLLHPGQSSAARDSAATHTGAMTGDYEVMRVLVEQAGVIVVESIEELGDVVELTLRSPVLPRAGTAVIAESGAFKALTLDLGEKLGLELPPLTEENARAIRAALPAFIEVSNPLDTTAQGLADPSMYGRLACGLMDDDRIGTIVLAIIQVDPVTCGIKLPAILDGLRKVGSKKAIVFCGMDEGAVIPGEYVDALRELGVTWLPTNERTFRALSRIHRHVPTGAQEIASDSEVLDLGSDRGVIPEYRAKALLAGTGIAFAKSKLAATVEDAIAAADSIGYPVVLKAQSEQLSHKSDAGGVALNLENAGAVRSAWQQMTEGLERRVPGVALDGILVESMVPRGSEWIVGARRDADWGPVVLVGAGGVMAELFHDFVLLPADISRETAMARLQSLKSYPLLTGYRGSPRLDVDALVNVVLKVGAVMRSNPEILEIDLNPVVAREAGAIALDALILASQA